MPTEAFANGSVVASPGCNGIDGHTVAIGIVVAPPAVHCIELCIECSGIALATAEAAGWPAVTLFAGRTFRCDTGGGIDAGRGIECAESPDDNGAPDAAFTCTDGASAGFAWAPLGSRALLFLQLEQIERWKAFAFGTRPGRK
eukprot:7386682-Prymnesium_polylepis.1